MLSVGQMVLYGTNGVCRVEDITVKRIGGNNIEYFVLKPVCAANSTLFIPTKNDALLAKIRDIVTQDEIREILDNLPEAGEWNDNKIERTEAFKATIARADCRELVEMIRLLVSHSNALQAEGKQLHLSDERLLKEAEKMISEEFSLVLGVEQDRVIPLILS